MAAQSAGRSATASERDMLTHPEAIGFFFFWGGGGGGCRACSARPYCYSSHLIIRRHQPSRVGAVATPSRGLAIEADHFPKPVACGAQ